MNNSKSLLSIVIPLYNEEDNVKNLLTTLLTFERQVDSIDLEFIFVDDHSQDRTFDILKVLTQQHKNIKMIRLAHNSGSHAAIMAGLTNASGDCATFIAGDLQDPPEVVLELVEKWKQGYKIVWAAREDEKGFGRPNFSKLYWWLCANMIETSIPEGGVDFFLIDRSVLEVVTNKPHRWSPIFVSVGGTKFSNTTVTYAKKERKTGKSGWTLSKKLGLVLDTMVMSVSAIRWLCVIGIAISAIGFIGLPISLAAIFLGSLPVVAGLVLVAICTVLCAMGFQTILMGIVGENVYRALSELRETPRFVVDQQIEKTSNKKLEQAKSVNTGQENFAPEQYIIPESSNKPLGSNVQR